MPKPLAAPLHALIFDLDGTLIDSKMDLVNSVNAMLRLTGRSPQSTEAIAGFIGHGAPRLIADVLGPAAGEDDRKNSLAIFLADYEKTCLNLTRPYPGVAEGLAALAPCPMAVLTNKPLKMARAILEGLDLAKFFRAAVFGGDSFPKKKPDPAGALGILRSLGATAEESAMVGDSDVDVQTARNAGMQAIAVTYGFGKYDRKVHPADLYVDSLTELLALPGVPRS